MTPTAITKSVANHPSSFSNAGNQFGQHSRTLGALHSGSRCISHVHTEINVGNRDFHGLIELDSHADTCTVGANFQITVYTEKSCNVTPYHLKYEGINDCPIVQAATAYMDSESGSSYILMINQGVYVGEELTLPLINPNQLRTNGVIVDDCPRHLPPDPSIATHSIFVPEHNLPIPLKLKGIFSCFTT